MTGCNRPPWSKEFVVSLWERRRSENPTSKQHRGARRNLLATDSCSSLSNRGSSMRTKHHGYNWYGTISLLHRQVTKCITQKKSRLTPKGSRPSSRNALSTPLPSSPDAVDVLLLGTDGPFIAAYVYRLSYFNQIKSRILHNIK